MKTAVGSHRCLRHVVVIHRHGDRCPGLPGTSGCSEEETEETKAWASLLPSPSLCQQLDNCIPVKSQAASDTLDSYFPPFGMLTNRGMGQLFRLGRSLQARYCSPPNVSDPVHSEHGSKVTAFSSNYRRTQQSVQLCLAGFLTKAAPSEQKNGNSGQVSRDVDRMDQSIDSSTNDSMEATVEGGEIAGALAQISSGNVRTPLIQVRADENCVINPFVRHPDMHRISVAMMESDQFREQEQRFGLDSVRKELESKMPLFAASEGRHYGSFKWLLATDSLLGYKFHPELPIPASLQDLCRHTDKAFEHLRWNFSEFYSEPTLLKLACGDILAETVQQMEACRANCNTQTRSSSEIVESATEYPSVAIYSGHDTTLMPVLVALGLWDGLWPPFASSLALELWESKVQDSSDSTGSVSSRDPATCKRHWYVRAVYNDAVVPFPCGGLAVSPNLGVERDAYVLLEDFKRLVDHVVTGRGPMHARGMLVVKPSAL
eukprot:TRINITY_DN27977_c0_g1_i1.p1 TRINITY_DN27977_c0_g1~~TRINITY_DN27977_c0_g1_i1.p1  ORF type:complete len:489 (+),score=67.49 TRINITY_DN27977_c0_g1_i1:96-1562(+)